MRGEHTQISQKDGRELKDRLTAIQTRATDLAKRLRDTAATLHHFGCVDDCKTFEDYAEVIDDLESASNDMIETISRRM